MKPLLAIFSSRYDKNPKIVAVMVAGIVLLIDYLTGKYVQFPILYAIPVGLAAWKLKKSVACSLAMLLPIIRIFFHYPWNETISIPATATNATIRMIALLIYAYLINRTAWQAKALETKVKVLEGILPICSFCKRIRNEKGEYEQIEKCVMERSSASFSHGICRECAKKMYPEIYRDKE